ncbi:MAG: hypothetical protein IH852_01595 [Bacteroidetes bacterium]|nr:hypothetical protein [Bacteroidota bacterium]
MDSSNIELITLISSLVIGVIVALVTRSTDSKGKKKVEWGITLSSILIVALIGSHLQTRAEANKIKSLLQFYAQFSENPDAVSVAKKELIVNNVLSENYNFLRNIYLSKNKRYQNNLDFLSDYKIQYDITNLAELGEMQNDALKIFDLADKNTRIRATSYVNVDQWWNNEFGLQYKDANKKASERGVKIERIWIIKSKEELNNPSMKKTLNEEKTWKIKSYYVLEEDIQDFDEHKIDIIIVTTIKNVNAAFYGELNLTLFRKMITVTFASNNQRLIELENYWDDLMNVAVEY